MAGVCKMNRCAAFSIHFYQSGVCSVLSFKNQLCLVRLVQNFCKWKTNKNASWEDVYCGNKTISVLIALSWLKHNTEEEQLMQKSNVKPVYQNNLREKLTATPKVHVCKKRSILNVFTFQFSGHLIWIISATTVPRFVITFNNKASNWLFLRSKREQGSWVL